PVSMLKNLWLTFAQAVTIALALLFTVATLRPEWLPQRLSGEAPPAPAVVEAPASVPAPGTGENRRVESILSYSDAARRATAAVVNIYTTKTGRAGDHPLLNDPLFRRFFGDPSNERQTHSPGSGVI